jgi:hypothetical protein
MGLLRIFFWLIYEANKYAMNLYWLLWLRFWYDGHLTWFAHFIGVMSFLFMISNIIYALSGTEA